jgi:hypothetical protein
MLPDRPPQVTFSCDSSDGKCAFQFWTAEVESFYCSLEKCQSKAQRGYNFKATTYACEKIKCGTWSIHLRRRWECWSVYISHSALLTLTSSTSDIGEFLTEEIKGPGTFSCKTGPVCRFEEPAMNKLIDTIFGDSYITLECEGGECLHYSQVPGYVVCPYSLPLPLPPYPCP